MTENFHQLRILHLSDLHECATTPDASEARQRNVELQAVSRNRVLGRESNITDILHQISQEYPIDMVCFTGDIAYSGSSEEYNIATCQIEKLLNAADCPIESFFVIPGNHDINRNINKDNWNNIRAISQESNGYKEISKAMASFDGNLRGAEQGWRENILKRGSDFWNWVEVKIDRKVLHPRENKHKYLGYSTTFKKNGVEVPIQVIGLDSSWLSGNDADNGNIFITKEQIDLLCYNYLSDPFPGFRIALIHHPLYNLKDKKICERYLASSIDLLLVGHTHEPSISIINNPDFNFPSNEVGCLYEDDQYTNSFNVIDVFLNKDGQPTEAIVRYWSWSEDNLQWYHNQNYYETMVDGKMVIPFHNRRKTSNLSNNIGLYDSPKQSIKSPQYLPDEGNIQKSNESITYNKKNPDIPGEIYSQQQIQPDNVSSSLLGKIDKDLILEDEALAETSSQEQRNFEVLLKEKDDLSPKIADEPLQNQPDLLEIFQLIKQGDTLSAKNMLDEHRDDQNPFWLQLYAHSLIHTNDTDGAATALFAAANLIKNPYLSQYAASVACLAGRYEEALEVLSATVNAFPDIEEPRVDLVNLLMKKNDYTTALEHLKILNQIKPDETAYTINLASTLTHLFKFDEALIEYNKLCNLSNPSKIAVISRAILLRLLGKLKEAFESIEPYQEFFRDDSEFNIIFTDIALSSGHDTEAGLMVNQLQQLSKEDKIDDNLIKTISRNELQEIILSRNNEENNSIREVIAGKLPWIAPSLLSHQAVYLNWYRHTRHLNWVSDEPVERARHTVYATNSVKPITINDGPLENLIKSSPSGSPVVVDITALITLHQLDLLDKTAHYFNRLVLPSIYINHLLSDSIKLQSFQQSKFSIANELYTAYNNQTLYISNEDLPVINEYPSDKDIQHSYSIRDVIDALIVEGRISSIEQDRLFNVAHRSTGVDSAYSPLSIRQAVIIHLSTLESLFITGVLPIVLNFFRVHILAEDFNIINSRILEFEEINKIFKCHFDLCMKIQTNPHFEVEPLILSNETHDDNRKNNHLNYCISSMLLSIEKGLPLLADDRACQAAIHFDSSITQDAFGVSEVIIALLDDELISEDQATEALLKLVNWRYRFLFFPANLLKIFTKRYHNKISRPLRDIARYVQNCMRDPGLLHCTIGENSPLMAEVYYQKWLINAVHLVIEVWEDLDFEENQANDITKWVITELTPSPPTCLSPLQQHKLSMHLPYSFLGFALSRAGLCQGDNILSRMNIAMQSIRDAFGLSEEEYVNIIAEDLYVIGCK